MPGETAQAICCMIFGGVLERYPKLKVCFAHGGKQLGMSSTSRLKSLISCQLMHTGQILMPNSKMLMVAALLDTISKNMYTLTYVRNKNYCVNDDTSFFK